MPGITPTPWEVNRAIWDEATGDVAYVLEGNKYANGWDAKVIEVAPDSYAVAQALEKAYREVRRANG